MSVIRGFLYGFGGFLGVLAAAALVALVCLVLAASKVREFAVGVQTIHRAQQQQQESGR